MTDIMEVTENVNQEILNVNVETATASLNSGKKTSFENATAREETRCRTIGKEVKAVDDFECSVIPRKRARTEYSSIGEVNIPEETFELKSMSSDETVLRPVFHEALASSINTKEIPTEERIGIDTPIINKVEIPIVNSPTEATIGKKENFSVEETSSTLEGIRDVQDFKKIEKNIPMMGELFEETNHSLWSGVNFYTAYKLVEVYPGVPEYTTVYKKFDDSLREIKYIYRVENPFLYAQYHLKMKQKQSMHGVLKVKEHLVFHGTKECNEESICKNNFDYRKMGCYGYVYDKFGKGISFATNTKYAMDYPRRDSNPVRTMFFANVLEVERCSGECGLIIPPEPADLSASENVYVKFFDNEFYPKYLVHYKRK